MQKSELSSTGVNEILWHSHTIYIKIKTYSMSFEFVFPSPFPSLAQILTHMNFSCFTVDTVWSEDAIYKASFLDKYFQKKNSF